MIVDAHSHLGEMSCEHRSADAERILADQVRLGIAASVVSSHDALLGSLREGNERVIRAAETHASLYALLVLDPRRMAVSRRLLDRFASHERVVGIKIHPRFHEYGLDTGIVTELMEMVRSAGLPVMSHCQSDSPYTGMHLRTRAEEFPDITFIAAHFGIGGDGPPDRIVEIFGEPAPANLLTDTATRRMIEYGFFEHAVATIGADRILWGSDSVYYEPSATLAVLQTARIDDEDREKIACRNALRVYGPRLRTHDR